MRGVKIFAIKRRVFAHHHGIKAMQGAIGMRVPHFKPRILLTCEMDLLHLRVHRMTTLPNQMVGFTRKNLVAAFLRLSHHRKRGVFVNLERRQRVGNEKYVHSLNFNLATQLHHRVARQIQEVRR